MIDILDFLSNDNDDPAFAKIGNDKVAVYFWEYDCDLENAEKFIIRLDLRPILEREMYQFKALNAREAFEHSWGNDTQFLLKASEGVYVDSDNLIQFDTTRVLKHIKSVVDAEDEYTRDCQTEDEYSHEYNRKRLALW